MSFISGFPSARRLLPLKPCWFCSPGKNNKRTHSKSYAWFNNANARKFNTEVMHDVINDCTIARFEDLHVKPKKSSEFNRRLLTTHIPVPYNKMGIYLALIN
jgi:hypothetical protein